MDLIRHGESTFNAQISLLGRDPNIPDAPLTARGQDQVRQAARRLSPGSYDLIVSSPYSRALHTASLLAEVIGAPVIVDPLAGERCLYSCDIGTPASRLKPLWPKLDFSRLTNDIWWPQGPESEESLQRRIDAFFAHWEQTPHRILVATHCHFIHGVTGHAPSNAELIKVKTPFR